jgi:hypothetical protein
MVCHSLVRCGQAVETRADHRLQIRRHCDVAQVAFSVEDAGVVEHAHRLLEEERVSARVPKQLLRAADGEPPGAEKLAEERFALLLAECRERDCRPPVGVDAEVLPKLAQLAPGRPEHEDRPGGFADEVDQVEERRLRPVQVLENEHERAFGREKLEHAPDSPVELGLGDVGRRRGRLFCARRPE